MTTGRPSTAANERVRPQEPPISFSALSGPGTRLPMPRLTEKNTVELQPAVPAMLLAANRLLPGRSETTSASWMPSSAFSNPGDGVKGRGSCAACLMNACRE